MHVHVSSPNGEAKFWIEPVIALADHCGLKKKELRELELVVREKKNEITRTWKAHFEL